MYRLGRLVEDFVLDVPASNFKTECFRESFTVDD
jgi:hypothetical protein